MKGGDNSSIWVSSALLFASTAWCFRWRILEEWTSSAAGDRQSEDGGGDDNEYHLDHNEQQRDALLQMYISRRMTNRLSFHETNNEDDDPNNMDEPFPPRPPSSVADDAASTATSFGDFRSSAEQEGPTYGSHNNWKHFEGYHTRDSDNYHYRKQQRNSSANHHNGGTPAATDRRNNNMTINHRTLSRMSSFGSDGANHLDKMLEGDDRREDDDVVSESSSLASSFDYSNNNNEQLSSERPTLNWQDLFGGAKQFQQTTTTSNNNTKKPKSSMKQPPSSSPSNNAAPLPTIISQTVMADSDLFLSRHDIRNRSPSLPDTPNAAPWAAAVPSPPEHKQPVRSVSVDDRTNSKQLLRQKQQRRQSPSFLTQLSSSFKSTTNNNNTSTGPSPRRRHSDPNLLAADTDIATTTTRPANNNNNTRQQNNRVARKFYNANIMPNNLFLIRHGQSLGNTDEKLYSTTPDNAMPLTKLGWQQAREAGIQLQRILLERNQSSGRDHHHRGIHFILSPYVRTVETFHGIVSAWCDPQEFIDKFETKQERLRAWYSRLLEMGLTWHEDPRIREQDFGNYQEPDKIQQAKRDRYRFGAFYYRFPHGESASDVFDRVSTFLDSLWRSFDTNDTKYYVLITHGISIRVILARYFRYTIDQFHLLANPRNCEMVVLGHDGSGRLELDGRYELEVQNNADENKDDDCKNNKNVIENSSRITGYKFHKRLRVLPEKAVRKVRIRMCFDE